MPASISNSTLPMANVSAVRSIIRSRGMYRGVPTIAWPWLPKLTMPMSARARRAANEHDVGRLDVAGWTRSRVWSLLRPPSSLRAISMAVSGLMALRRMMLARVSGR